MKNWFLAPLALFCVITALQVKAAEQTESGSTAAKPAESIFTVKDAYSDHDRIGQTLNRMHGTWHYQPNGEGTRLEETWTKEINPIGTRTEWKDAVLVRKVQISIKPSRNGGATAKFEVTKPSESGEKITNGLIGTITDEDSGATAKISFITGTQGKWQPITFRYRLLGDDRLELVEESETAKKIYVYTRARD